MRSKVNHPCFVSGEALYLCSKRLLAAGGALAEMQCIVRMMLRVASGVVLEQECDRAVLKKIGGVPSAYKKTKA